MRTRILAGLAVGLLAGPMTANSVPYETNIFVRGGFNDWSANDDNMMSYDASSESYRATLTVLTGFYNFRIASIDLSIDLGNLGGSPLVQLNTPWQLSRSGANLEISLTTPGGYSFLLDTRPGLDTPTLIVRQYVHEAPEPGTLALLGLGLAGLGLSRRRRA